MSPQLFAVTPPGAMDLDSAQALLANPQVMWSSPSSFLNALQLDAIATVLVDSQGRALHAVRMTLPFAKTLASALTQLVAQYESVTDQVILGFDEIAAKMVASQSGASPPGN